MHFKKIPLNFNFDGWYRLTEVLNLYRKRKFHRTDLQYYRKKLNPFLQSYRLAVNERLRSNLGSLGYFIFRGSKRKRQIEAREPCTRSESSKFKLSMEISDRNLYPVFSRDPRFHCGNPSCFTEIEPLGRYLFVFSSQPQRIQRELANDLNMEATIGTQLSLPLFSSQQKLKIEKKIYSAAGGISGFCLFQGIPLKHP